MTAFTASASPKVSVIITTYNRADLVCRAIESVLHQTYRDYELIMVDDGSTDNTSQRLKFYGDRLRYIYQHNRGVAAARNAGVRTADGEWVAFLDSDDVWHPTKLREQVEALSMMGGSFGACFTNWRDSVSGLTAFEQTELPYSGDAGRIDNPHRYILPNRYALCIPSLLVSRSLLLDLNGFDETVGIAEDRDLVFRLAFTTHFCYVASPLVTIDRSPKIPRLTDWCSSRSNQVYLWGELLLQKMLAHPALRDGEMRRILQEELICLYYDWATARVRDLDISRTRKLISKLRCFGQSYPAIFETFMTRAACSLSRSLQQRIRSAEASA